MSPVISSQSQASNSVKVSVDAGQEISIDLEQHSNSAEEKVRYCESDPAPCQSQEAAISTRSSPISDGVSKDQNITEDAFTPFPISTVTTSQTVIDSPKSQEANASATTGVKSDVHVAIAELLGRSRTIQSEDQNCINRLKDFSDMPLWDESVESTIPGLDADVRETKAQQQIPAERCSKGQCEKGDSQIESGDSQLQECISIISHGSESALPTCMDTDKLGDADRIASSPMDVDGTGSPVAMDAELKVDNDEHGDIGEVQIVQVGANDVIDESSHTQSVESNLRICVPLIPELQLPFRLVKEKSRSDDAEEANDHTDSSHATQSTDACLTQSAESANLINSELEQPLVPFKEHPLSSFDDHYRDSVGDQNNKNNSMTTSTCTGTTPSIVPTTTDTDSSTNACIELNSGHNNKHAYDHNSIDVDLLHSDLTTEVHDQIIEDDCSSPTSGIITTSACYRKDTEWSDTNSDSRSSSAGLLSRSGSYSWSDSFNSCDRFSLLGDGTRSGSVRHTGRSSPFDALCDSTSGEEMVVERPTSLSSSSFRRKKAWDSDFYAASKIIMTRSKFADLRRIGDDFTISQALSSPFCDISNDSLGSGSPEEEEEEEGEGMRTSKTTGCRQLGRSLSVSSMESASSSVCSLQGDDNSGR
jgi:hypothetical protein